jgi:hypothetical protein
VFTHRTVQNLDFEFKIEAMRLYFWRKSFTAWKSLALEMKNEKMLWQRGANFFRDSSLRSSLIQWKGFYCHRRLEKENWKSFESKLFSSLEASLCAQIL